MKIVTAPDNDSSYDRYLTVFLAGGITGCVDWQDRVIEELLKLDSFVSFDRVMLLNPRRSDFDVSNIELENEQIKWEYRWLKRCDIFSVFFAASESVQPIALYELGRRANCKKATAISVQHGYKRERDVLMQTSMDNLPCNIIYGDEPYKEHALNIANAIKRYRGGK